MPEIVPDIASEIKIATDITTTREKSGAYIEGAQQTSEDNLFTQLRKRSCFQQCRFKVADKGICCEAA